MKNGTNLTKGKKNQFTVSKIEDPFNRKLNESNCSPKMGVSYSNDLQKVTSCQIVDGVVKTSPSDTTVADLNGSDKYELEIQTKI